MFEYWSGPRISVRAAELPEFEDPFLLEDYDPARTFRASLSDGDFIVSIDDLLSEGRPDPAFASVDGFHAREVNMYVVFDVESLTAVLRFGDEPTMDLTSRVFTGHWLDVAGAQAAMNRIVEAQGHALAAQFRAELLRIKRDLDHSRVAQAIAAHSCAERILGYPDPTISRIAELTGYDAALVRRTTAALRERGINFGEPDEVVPDWLARRHACVAELERNDPSVALWNERMNILDARISDLESGVSSQLAPIAGLKVDVRDALTIVGQAGLLEMIMTESETNVVNRNATFRRLRAAGFHADDHVLWILVNRLEELEVFE